MTGQQETYKATVAGTIVDFRPDALARLYARKSLDFQQYEAGQRLRSLIERARVSPLKAQEYDRVYLDRDVVIGQSAGLVPRLGDAMKRLVQIEIDMGVPDFPICTAIVCEDMRFVEMLRRMPRLLARYRENTLGCRVGEAFDKLARLV